MPSDENESSPDSPQDSRAGWGSHENYVLPSSGATGRQPGGMMERLDQLIAEAQAKYAERRTVPAPGWSPEAVNALTTLAADGDLLQRAFDNVVRYRAYVDAMPRPAWLDAAWQAATNQFAVALAADGVGPDAKLTSDVDGKLTYRSGNDAADALLNDVLRNGEIRTAVGKALRGEPLPDFYSRRLPRLGGLVPELPVLPGPELTTMDVVPLEELLERDRRGPRVFGLEEVEYGIVPTPLTEEEAARAGAAWARMLLLELRRPITGLYPVVHASQPWNDRTGDLAARARQALTRQLTEGFDLVKARRQLTENWGDGQLEAVRPVLGTERTRQLGNAIDRLGASREDAGSSDPLDKQAATEEFSQAVAEIVGVLAGDDRVKTGEDGKLSYETSNRDAALLLDSLLGHPTVAVALCFHDFTTEVRGSVRRSGDPFGPRQDRPGRYDVLGAGWRGPEAWRVPESDIHTARTRAPDAVSERLAALTQELLRRRIADLAADRILRNHWPEPPASDPSPLRRTGTDTGSPDGPATPPPTAGGGPTR